MVIEADVAPDLQRVATSFGLSIVPAENADHALRAVLSLRVGLIVLQVSRLVDEAVKFIGLVEKLPRPVPLIAVASSHSEQLERDVWHAGATWYLPETSTHLLSQVLRAVLPQGCPVPADQGGASG